MAAGDIMRLQLVGSMDGDIVQNNFYYKVDTDDSSGENEEPLATQFDVDVIPSWEPVVTPDMSLDCIAVQKVFPDPKRALIEKFITSVGTATGQALPLVVSALLQKIDPALSGRGKKGHTYIAGISEDQTKDGRIQSALNITLLALASKLTQNLTTPGLGVYNPVWAIVSAVAPFIITGFVDWTKSTVLPRLSHQSTRKTPVRKIASP